MTQVVPAIIPQTIEQMQDEIGKVSWFAKNIQIDISDGIFTKSKTWPYNGRGGDFYNNLKEQQIGWPKWDTVDYEVHLMVKSPETVAVDWIKTGAGSIVAHIEATENFQMLIDICKANEVSVGIAILPSTDISKIEPFVSQIDFIQVMGSDHIGEHGVPLEDSALDMIKRLRGLYPERIIAIDIGVTLETKGELTSAGANKLIVGRALLESSHPKEVFDNLSL